MARLTGNVTLAALTLVTGALLPGSVFAQEGDGTDSDSPYSVEYADGALTLRESASRDLLLEQSSQKFVISRIEGSLAPEVDVEIVADGYSMHYSFTNSTSSAKPLPDLRVGPILLGDHVTYQDTRHSCEDVQTDAANHRTPGHNYPVNMYSPVWIVRSGEHAAGVSLEYPIMEYKHDVRIYMRYHQRSGGWLVDMRLSSESGALEHSAMVPPGDTWQYTVNVRFTPKSNEWVRTLVPYRDYFRNAYGGVQYQRATNSINAVGLSLGAAQSDENPYGFSREQVRPDHYGFGPFVDYALARGGWPEFMIITPTGLYRHNVHLNYPFKFTSEWMSRPEFETALDPGVGFPKIVSEGKNLGFWWGRSAQVSFDWDDSRSEQLDPSNPAHVEAAFDELDLAVQAGARTIGMDTFGYRAIPLWDSYPWLTTMQQRYPEVKFVLEPMPSDIMHTKAAGWLRGFNDGQPVETEEELNFIKGPHVLADFLLPGHETWAAWRYKGHRLYLDITPTQELVDQDVRRFAEWGYRPMIYTEFDLTESIPAAESWRYSIPIDLQLPPDNGSDDGSGGGSGSGALTDAGAGEGQSRGGRTGGSPGGSAGVARRAGAKSPRAVGVSGAEAREALLRARQHLGSAGKRDK